MAFDYLIFTLILTIHKSHFRHQLFCRSANVYLFLICLLVFNPKLPEASTKNQLQAWETMFFNYLGDANSADVLGLGRWTISCAPRAKQNAAHTLNTDPFQQQKYIGQYLIGLFLVYYSITVNTNC